MTDFIHEEYIQDLSVCDELIDYHTKSDHKIEGKTSLGINPMTKVSTDCGLLDETLFRKYDKQLSNVVNNYIKKFPWCNGYDPWKYKEGMNIQYYKPNEGFLWWHTERGRSSEPYSSRHLVFMTYLNDVTDGGGTEFYHQEKVVDARKGKTVIWPADWTHTHKGIVSPTQDKYIITGWFNFI
jgi:hypothetical protein